MSEPSTTEELESDLSKLKRSKVGRLSGILGLAWWSS